MDSNTAPSPTHSPGTERARFAMAIGGRASMTAEVSVTPAGLLAIGALVSGILLSSAVIVRAARRNKPLPPRAQGRLPSPPVA
jgi:hypothetical protein